MRTDESVSLLRVRDALAVAFNSLRTRRLRAGLTIAGVAIGIAAMVGTLGVSLSTQADLLATLDTLGTNMLTVTPGRSFLGRVTALPPSAPASIRHLASVGQATSIAILDATVRRTDLVPVSHTGGIQVAATETSLLETLKGSLRSGRFIDAAIDEYPAVVLGATAARRLGIGSLESQPRVWIGNQWFAVVGTLDPMVLAPEIDSTALMGFPATRRVLGVPSSSTKPTSVYVRTHPEMVDQVRDLLPRAANPGTPEAVRVSRPSDALAARAAASTAFTALLVGLGGVALLVSGVGIANVMVMAVLERRTEIGLRRALGAARHHIRAQFLIEAAMLSAVGGLIGVTLGIGITAGFALQRGLPFALPIEGIAAAMLVAVLVGVIAGLYPSGRAARLQPAEAIRPR